MNNRFHLDAELPLIMRRPKKKIMKLQPISLHRFAAKEFKILPIANCVPVRWPNG